MSNRPLRPIRVSPRRKTQHDFVPTLADRLLYEADRYGVARAASVDDAQEPGAHPIGPDHSHADNR